MEPIPETAEALDLYGPFFYENQDLQERLVEVSREVRELVPDCIGLSLSLSDLEVTLTMAASSTEVALLDATQYDDGGPCVTSMAERTPVAYALDHSQAETSQEAEERWRIFARSTAAAGVGSTLSLPILQPGRGVVGCFNLYARGVGSFDGHHEQLGDLLGAWAGGAVTDADLSWSTRDLAARAPAILHGSARLALAAGLLAESLELTVPEVEQRIREAALQAGVELPPFAAALVDVLRR